MRFIPRIKLNSRRASEEQITQEISSLIHGKSVRPYPLSVTETAKLLGVCRGTVYNYLKRIRDNSLLQTESGRSFMESFNQFYYSFSPGIADLERENPIFKEAVKLTITPLLSSLSLLNYVDMDSEETVLGYGISLILLNVGMYFVAPALIVIRIFRIKCNSSFQNSFES